MSRPSSTDASRFDITAKEAELRRRNEELDALKQQVVRKAEAALKEPGGKLAKDTRDIIQTCLSTRASSESIAQGPSMRESDIYSSRQSLGSPSENNPIPAVSNSSRPTIDRYGTASQPAGNLVTPQDSSNAVIDGASLEAQVRFLKAKLKVAQGDLETAKSENERKDLEISSLRQKLKDSSDSLSSAQKALSSLEIQLEKATKQSEETKSKLLATEQQLLSIRKEHDSTQKAQKQSESDNSARNARLNRALEEVEKYKKLWKEASEQGRESSGLTKQQFEKMTLDLKKLEKQKTELLQAFKKQQKLIDTLKRQKLHLEAARLLSFTEEEFSAVLELGERAN